MNTYPKQSQTLQNKPDSPQVELLETLNPIKSPPNISSSLLKKANNTRQDTGESSEIKVTQQNSKRKLNVSEFVADRDHDENARQQVKAKMKDSDKLIIIYAKKEKVY